MDKLVIAMYRLRPIQQSGWCSQRYVLHTSQLNWTHVHSRSTSVYLAGIYCHQIISIWNALPHSDSGVTAPTLSNLNSCVDISVFAVFHHFMLGHMLEVVFQPFVPCSVQCTVLLHVFTLLLYLFRINYHIISVAYPLFDDRCIVMFKFQCLSSTVGNGWVYDIRFLVIASFKTSGREWFCMIFSGFYWLTL